MIVVAEKYLEDIEKLLGKKLDDEEQDLLIKAYEFARQAHEGQMRESGEPFFTHVVEVSKLVAELKLDVTAVVSALLHDVLEDCKDKGYTLEQIVDEFGSEVARIVDGVTKINELNIETKIEDETLSSRIKLATLQKMIMAMAADLRVILVKLCDRLHNMRTLHHVKDPEKVARKSRETLKIYAPIAHKLGIHRIMWELEDLAFKHLHPDDYRKLKKLVARKLSERERVTNMYINKLGDALKSAGIKAEVTGRVKHFYSIWRKMREKNKEFDEIYDLIALRVITDDKDACYSALGIAHSIWNPVPGRFKDYIAVPKSNGYKSLHTTVITERGEYLEIQIRSRKMHEEAEYGLAAHWAYKEGLDTKNKWITRLIEWHSEVVSGLSHLKDLETELEMDEVFVFTPKGEVKHLPKGATPIDFAYTIHTEIGHHYAGAKVNGRMVPINYELQMGDVVEIIVNKNSSGPSLDWLKYAKSPRTRAKIRRFFKEKYHQELVERGKEVLRRLSKRLSTSVDEILESEKIQNFMIKNGIGSTEDLMSRLGDGSITFYDLLKLFEPTVVTKKHKKAPKSLKQSPVIVEGLTGIDVNMAGCCHPIPGDPIVGVISRRGITIHHEKCSNIKNVPDDKFVEVTWARQFLSTDSTVYLPTWLEIEVRSGKAGSIVAYVEHLNLSHKLEVNRKDENVTFIKLHILVKNSTHLEELINMLKGIDGVEKVRRLRHN